MWPWVLGSAALGGLQAYGQSGGDLGKTLTGAAIGGGLGALIPGAGRMAGAALEGTGVLTPLASGLTQAATKGRQALGLIGPAQAVTPGRLAAAAGGLTTAALGAAVPGIAAGLSGVPGRAAQAAFGGGAAMGVGRPGTPGVYDFEGKAVPIVDSTGNVYMVGSTPQEVANPLGRFAAGRLQEEMETDTQARNMQKLLATTTPWTEGAKKAEMLRQLTASGVRTNQATQAQMTLNAQRAAQQMGANALNTGLSALATQYQYG